MRNSIDIWKILEIEETKDEQLIKKAYASLLEKYHPEEHPEMFEKIQNAYRRALVYARQEELEKLWSHRDIVIDIKEGTKEIISDDKEEDYYNSNVQKIMDYINQLHEAIIDNNMVCLTSLLDDESILYIRHTPNFNFRLAIYLQLCHELLTDEQMELLKMYTTILAKYVPNVVDAFIIKTYNAITLSRKNNTDFFSEFLQTKDTTEITLYIEYIKYYFNNYRSMDNDIVRLLSTLRKKLYIGNEKPLIDFFQSEAFDKIKDNIYFIEMFDEELSYGDTRRYITEKLKQVIEEQYNGSTGYCSMRIHSILEGSKKYKPIWLPGLNFSQRKLLKHKDSNAVREKIASLFAISIMLIFLFMLFGL